MRAIVERTQRASNSWSGNPTVRVTTDQGTYLTETDSHSGLVALGLEPGDVVELTITEGRIEYIDEIRNEEEETHGPITDRY
jgi:hypothetical protein